MKTTLKQVAAGTLIAMLLVIGNTKVNAAKTKASGHENMETALQLENWMTDELTWNTDTKYISEFVSETEAGLEVEDWMISPDSWNTINEYSGEIEPKLELECWMLNDETWSSVQSDNESSLIVESWMINDSYWK